MRNKIREGQVLVNYTPKNPIKVIVKRRSSQVKKFSKNISNKKKG